MRNILIIILALLSFSACCRKVTPVSSEKIDSVRVVREVEYIERLRDTTIYVSVPVEVKEVTTMRDSSFLETSLAASKAVINKDGSLYHSLENKPQEIPVKAEIKETDTKETDIKETVKIELREVAVKMPLSGWQKFIMWSGGVAWVLLIFFTIYKLKKLIKI